MIKILSLGLVLILSATAQKISAKNDNFEISNVNESELKKPSYRFPPLVIREKAFSVISFTKVNWYMAQQICSYRGMTLASINSAAEAQQLQRLLVERGHASDIFWLSGTNLSDRNHWVWLSSGLYLSYQNWDKGQPNINLRCLRLLPDGKWDSFNCDGLHFFICENRCPFNGQLILI